jgi:hypothetical protein
LCTKVVGCGLLAPPGVGDREDVRVPLGGSGDELCEVRVRSGGVVAVCCATEVRVVAEAWWVVWTGAGGEVRVAAEAWWVVWTGAGGEVRVAAEAWCVVWTCASATDDVWVELDGAGLEEPHAHNAIAVTAAAAAAMRCLAGGPDC